MPITRPGSLPSDHVYERFLWLSARETTTTSDSTRPVPGRRQTTRYGHEGFGLTMFLVDLPHSSVSKGRGGDSETRTLRWVLKYKECLKSATTPTTRPLECNSWCQDPNTEDSDRCVSSVILTGTLCQSLRRTVRTDWRSQSYTQTSTSPPTSRPLGRNHVSEIGIDTYSK